MSANGNMAPMGTEALKYYEFSQNNVRGSYSIDQEKGIGVFVYIQAPDYRTANDIAQEKGLDVQGLDEDDYCHCCGNRWNGVYDERDAFDTSDAFNKRISYFKKEFSDWFAPENRYAFLHKYDGTIVELWNL